LAPAHEVRARDVFRVEIAPREDGSLDLNVFGGLDLLSGTTLEGALLGAIAVDGPDITLDLTEVTFMDSGGLLALLSLAEMSQETGDWLRIRCGSSPVHRVIESCGAEGRLPLLRP